MEIADQVHIEVMELSNNGTEAFPTPTSSFSSPIFFRHVGMAMAEAPPTPPETPDASFGIESESKQSSSHFPFISI